MFGQGAPQRSPYKPNCRKYEEKILKKINKEGAEW
jgi:hypothetical protein